MAGKENHAQLHRDGLPFGKILRFTSFAVIMTISCSTHAQRYIQADPFNLMYVEKAHFSNGEDYDPLLIRPLFKPRQNPGGNWAVTVRSELFSNTGAPNLENTSDRWIGKGQSFFSSINISYTGRFIALSLEPFYFTSENEDYAEPGRTGKFSRLNDSRAHAESPYTTSGLRESQIYLHYKGIGIGISKANMWWGPGIHSTLNMTNNTTGFKHLMIGTLREKRIWKVGLNVRYLFSEMDSLNASEPYYTAFLFSVTLHSAPVVTVGLSRTYLSGGNRTNEKITRKKAVLIPFEALFLESKQTDPNDPTSALDIWDQTLAGYLTADFPESGLNVFLEYGRNDHAWDKKDFWRQPDHTAAAIVGLRKYGLFGNKNLTFSVEYANLISSRFVLGGLAERKRAGADWYDRWQYDFSSYNGRHWGAHSGPDSDDFTIYFGYLGGRFSIIPALNYERHGATKEQGTQSEVKREFRLDLRFVLGSFRMNGYYERELVDNVGFSGRKRGSSVIWLGVERHFDQITFASVGKRIKSRFLQVR